MTMNFLKWELSGGDRAKSKCVLTCSAMSKNVQDISKLQHCWSRVTSDDLERSNQGNTRLAN